MMLDWRVCHDRDTLLKTALDIVLRSEADSGDAFSIVLAGGQTPLELYKMLARETLNWNKWHVFLGDERCLPVDDPGRNSIQARRALLDHVPIPEKQIFIPPAELGPVQAASRYSEALAGIGNFDLVLLGLGEDGHTASLFPGCDIGLEAHAPDVLAVFDAPKPPPERISLSASRLSRSSQVMFLVTGEGKREAVARWKNGEAIPASIISALQRVTVLVDEDAWPV